MNHAFTRIAAVAALATLACLALAGCGADMDQDSTNKLGIALGAAIVLLSFLGMRFQGRHFTRKRQQGKRKNGKKKRR